MHADRLTKLAEFLDTLEPEKFDINRWVSKCETVCCAWGWCPSVFPELKHIYDQDGDWDDIVFGDLAGSDAMKSFFDLGYEDVRQIFMPGSYSNLSPVHPVHVAQKIRGIVCT